MRKVLGALCVGALAVLAVHLTPPAVAAEKWVQMLTTDGGAGTAVSRDLGGGGQWMTLLCRGQRVRYVTCEYEPCTSPRSDGGLGQLVYTDQHHDFYLEGRESRVGVSAEDGGTQALCELKQLRFP